MNGYVVAGYLVVLLSLALYAARVVRRTRVLTRAAASAVVGDGNDVTADNGGSSGQAWT